MNNKKIILKKYRTIILCVFLCFLFGSLKSQYPQIDSLKKVLKQAKHDTTRCRALYRLGGWLEINNPDTAMIVFNQSERIARANLKSTLNKSMYEIFSRFLVNALNTQGYLYMNKSDSKGMYRCFSESVKLSEALKDKGLMATSNVNMGMYYKENGNSSKALDFYHKSLKLSLELNNSDQIGTAYNNIAYVYEDQGDYLNALDYFEKSLKAHKKGGDNFGMAVALNNIGVLYKGHGDPTCNTSNGGCRKIALAKALEAMTRALKIVKDMDDRGSYALIMSNISRIYEEQGDTVKAYEYTKASLSIQEELGNTYGIITSLHNISSYLLNHGQTAAALANSNKAFKLADNTGQPDLIMRSASSLKKIYKKQNKYKEALEMYELEVKMKDSLSNETTRKAAVKKQLQIEYEMQAQRDSLANEAKIIKEQLKHEQELTRQRSMTYVGLIGFLFMLLIAFVSFRAYKNKQKANELITQQKVVVENQKQQIEMANKDLERQHLLNQKIFSVISHDFRGPMLSLNLMLDKFRDKSSDNGLNEYVKNVNSEVTNANEILNNLLNWARTEINISSFSESTASVNKIMDEITRELNIKLAQKKLQLVSHIPDNSILPLPPDILRISLRNLISNAIKFSFENSKIDVLFDGKNASLTVKDFGIGMTEQTKNKLFIKEVDTELGTKNEEGFGIGLYILHELLHKYNYKIGVESAVNKGSSFTIQKK